MKGKLMAAILIILPGLNFSGRIQAEVPCGEKNPSAAAVKGGFTGLINSSVTWQSAGWLKLQEGHLCPYLYTLIWGESGRETARLVMFDGNYNYLGSYSLTGPQEIKVKNGKLIIITLGGKKESFIFNSLKMPDHIYVDGEVVELFK